MIAIVEILCNHILLRLYLSPWQEKPIPDVQMSDKGRKQAELSRDTLEMSSKEPIRHWSKDPKYASENILIWNSQTDKVKYSTQYSFPVQGLFGQTDTIQIIG